MKQVKLNMKSHLYACKTDMLEVYEEVWSDALTQQASLALNVPIVFRINRRGLKVTFLLKQLKFHLQYKEILHFCFFNRFKMLACICRSHTKTSVSPWLCFPK